MKTNRALICACLLCIAVPSIVQAQGYLIKSDFLTGNSFRALPNAQMRGYVMGFAAGAFVSPLFGAKKQDLVWLETCVTGMNDKQLLAVVEKWLAENPIYWHEQMNVLTFRALKESCK